jgi:hypothetical protein
VTSDGVTGFRVPGERFRRTSVKVCGPAVGRDQLAGRYQDFVLIFALNRLKDCLYDCCAGDVDRAHTIALKVAPHDQVRARLAIAEFTAPATARPVLATLLRQEPYDRSLMALAKADPAALAGATKSLPVLSETSPEERTHPGQRGRCSQVRHRRALRSARSRQDRALLAFFEQ